MMNGNWDIAKRLIEAGADVNQWDIYGQAPLHVAIENAYVSRAGVTNPGSTRRRTKQTEKKSCACWWSAAPTRTSRCSSVRRRNADRFPPARAATTPFHRAVASLDVDFIQYLLAHGADPTLYTAAGETPIMIAVEGRGGEDQVIAVLRLLKEAGTDVNALQKIMYITRDHGGTALHAATRKGSKKVMAELVRLGADPDVKDQDGLTALDYAMSRGWLTFLTTRPAPAMTLPGCCVTWVRRRNSPGVPDWPGEFPPIGPPRQHESEIWPL